MRHNKARFVTVCQQVLVVGAALAVLGPAADVISLDVVTHPEAAVGTYTDTPATATAPTAPTDPAAPATPATPATAPVAPARDKARVETAPVDPKVTEVAIAKSERAGVTAARNESGRAIKVSGTHEFVSDAHKVDGYGAVGVTWKHGEDVAEGDITVLARTKDNGTWSGWSTLEYHDDHGPDAGTDEGDNTRPGTEPLIIGDVDEVQTKVVTQGAVDPDDVQMAVVDPGASTKSAEEAPAIDTSKLAGGTAADGTPDVAADTTGTTDGTTTLETDQGAVALQAGSYTRKPTIYSRAQWGADESLRKGTVEYGEVHAGFVHHTVNANDYTAEQVPGIIRSIYAYHTQTKGWNDIGYNFLVDRFGRIWEGRYGGVDRPVVGAHTQGYNSYSFAASAIGNFEIVQPTSAMLDAYGRLFAWKLSLHGVSASSTKQWVGTKYFQAINGHRDADSTACPGKYLYAKIPSIRSIAAATQADWSGRDRTTDLAGSTYPDIVLRRASDGAAYVLRTDGMLGFGAQKVVGTGWSRFDVKTLSPDLTGDGRADMLVRQASNGAAGVRPGLAAGGFGGVAKVLTTFTGFDQVTPVGDLTGDGRNDVVARYTRTKALWLFRGDATGGFSRTSLSTAGWAYNRLVGTGDVSGDGVADLLAGKADGTLWLFRGTGKGALVAPTKVAGTWSYPSISGFGDFTADGRPDLFVRTAPGNPYVMPGDGKGGFLKPLGRLSGSFGGLTSFSGGQVLGGSNPDIVGFAGDSLVEVAHNDHQNLRPVIATGVKFTGVNGVLNVGDWDRDGFGDVITRSGSTGALSLYRGLGNGRFAAPTLLDSHNFNGISLLSAVGDTTGDGWPDLMGQPSGSSMRIYPGRGTAGLGASYVSHSAISSSKQIGLGRWDGDGAPDNAFRSGNSLTWLPGNGPGGLSGSAKSLSGDLAGYDWVIGAGDVTGDRRSDLIVRSATDGLLWVLPGTTSGFGTRIYLGQGFKGFDLAG
jgi:hypothetical protein